MCGFIGQLAFEKVDIENLQNANNRLICEVLTINQSLLKNLIITNLTIFNRLAIIDLNENANQQF